MSKTKLMSAKQVAEYFIWKSSQENKPVTNKKLQKLLYYAQAWSLVVRERKLFKEKIEAWIHGPAIREIYLEYKKFGFEPIVKEVSNSTIKKFSLKISKFLNEIWRVYGKYDAGYLEYLTHSEKPWQSAREGIEPHIGSENEISLDLMKDFYTKRLKEAKVSG